jgi:hypothetical protein
MLFTVKERLLVQSLLQKKAGNIVTIRLLHDLQMALGFSDKESAALELSAMETGVRWNTAKEKSKEIPMGKATHAIIAETLRELDATNALTIELLDLYEMFCGESAELVEDK